ncbi:unnamed protein product, partial [Discosporangium mesarthrocarpum]
DAEEFTATLPLPPLLSPLSPGRVDVGLDLCQLLSGYRPLATSSLLQQTADATDPAADTTALWLDQGQARGTRPTAFVGATGDFPSSATGPGGSTGIVGAASERRLAFRRAAVVGALEEANEKRQRRRQARRALGDHGSTTATRNGARVRAGIGPSNGLPGPATALVGGYCSSEGGSEGRGEECTSSVCLTVEDGWE